MKDQTSQGVHRKYSKYGPLENYTFWKYRWKTKLLKRFIEKVLCVDLWENPHLNIFDWRSKISRALSKYTKFEPLKKSTFRKHQRKYEFLKIFIEFELSVDLWKIPLSEKIDERSNFTRVSSKCTKYKPLENSTLRKYWWKTKLLKGFIENVLSLDLWKIHT